MKVTMNIDPEKLDKSVKDTIQKLNTKIYSLEYDKRVLLNKIEEMKCDWTRAKKLIQVVREAGDFNETPEW